MESRHSFLSSNYKSFYSLHFKIVFMQDKDLLNDTEKNKDEEVVPTDTEKTAEDGVVYVVNDDGTEFDASERTYVAVEGLEGEIGSDDTTKDGDE